MNQETIKRYNSEFSHWVEHGEDSVLWRYKEEKGEDCWRGVKSNGSPFTLDNTDIEYIVNDDMVELRKAERDGKQLEMLMHNTVNWRDTSTVDNAFLTRSAKEYRVKDEEVKLQYLYRVVPGECGYSTEWNITGYLTKKEVQERYVKGSNIIEVLEIHDRIKLIKIKKDVTL